ncbi:MAG TPA: cobalamin-dependent protein [Mycobacteriales bacterium]|nr:cobalamin-dependent protein [Mycobacteriales bacterium]
MTEGELVPSGLPPGRSLVDQGRRLARAVDTGWATYARNRGVRNERYYKERTIASGEITYYINLGLKSWPETRAALREVLAAAERLDVRVDRVSLTTDRRMGLAPELRREAIEETGIMFWTPEDWQGAAEDLDIMPILNDHSVGSPAGVDNALAAVCAGFGYVGNLSQMNYGYACAVSDVEQMMATVVAMGVIAEKKDDGVVLDSYTDDGFCASFHDAATSIGWCLLHRYIADDLVGCAYAPSYGSTFADPLLKQAFGLALDAINVSRVPPSVVHGDTNSLQPHYSLDRNAAIVTTDIYFTIANQLAHPTGTSVHPTPLTEPHRIPTVEDIVQSLEIGREAERRARQSYPLIDWRPVYALRDRLVAAGREVFSRMMDGLAVMGVDTSDALQLLIATRRLGAQQIERLFGAGEADTAHPRGRVPVVPTDTLRRASESLETVLRSINQMAEAPDLRGVKVVAASGDIHEYGLYTLVAVLEELGCDVHNLGTSVDNGRIAAAVAESAADVVALSTYNGMALSLGRDLIDRLVERGLHPTVYIGGRLTEDLPNQKSADVTAPLAAAGAVPCASITAMVESLSELDRSRLNLRSRRHRP